MTSVHRDLVPPDAEILIGARGSEYFYRNGKRVYITSTKSTIKRIQRFKPRKGKFTQWLENQQTNC
jgi:hypothetical protein